MTKFDMHLMHWYIAGREWCHNRSLLIGTLCAWKGQSAWRAHRRRAHLRRLGMRAFHVYLKWALEWRQVLRERSILAWLLEEWHIDMQVMRLLRPRPTMVAQ